MRAVKKNKMGVGSWLLGIGKNNPHPPLRLRPLPQPGEVPFDSAQAPSFKSARGKPLLEREAKNASSAVLSLSGVEGSGRRPKTEDRGPFSSLNPQSSTCPAHARH